MSKQQDWLVRAAVELGLRVETQHEIMLASGRRVVPEAFFPDLGSGNGMFVFNSSMPTETMAELLHAGYPASFFSEPHASEEYDIDTYAAMFAEWGWGASSAERPEWMDENEQ